MEKQVMGIRELRVLASQLGIKNYSKLNKADLIKAIDAIDAVDVVEKNPVQEIVPTNSHKIGEVNGRLIVVGPQDTVESIGLLLGSFDKGSARKIRKLLNANGFSKFAAVNRIEPKRVQEVA
jgi:hypothetical protein